jgi:hypothetical protein
MLHPLSSTLYCLETAVSIRASLKVLKTQGNSMPAMLDMYPEKSWCDLPPRLSQKWASWRRARRMPNLWSERGTFPKWG